MIKFISTLFAFLTLSFSSVAIAQETSKGDVLIFGATRNTGFEVAKILEERGQPVTAFVRPVSNLENLESLNVTYFTGDALNAEEVKDAVASKEFDAVISTLGGGRGETPPDLVGTINIVDAMEESGVQRLIVVTVIGPGESIVMVPEQQRQSLGRVIALKEEAENYIMASSLDYTIIRPGQLTSNPRSGIIRLSLTPEPTGPVTRADLADLVVGALDDPSTIGQVYQAIGDDPLMTTGRMDQQE